MFEPAFPMFKITCRGEYWLLAMQFINFLIFFDKCEFENKAHTQQVLFTFLCSLDASYTLSVCIKNEMSFFGVCAGANGNERLSNERTVKNACVKSGTC